MEQAPNLEDLYSGRILELSANSPALPRLANPHGTATAQSKLCGSIVTVDVRVEAGIVTHYGQDVKACLLGQTSAAIVGQNAVGSPVAELRAVGEQMRRMLKQDGPPPRGRWADLAILEMVRSYKARHASTLLVFDALEAAISEAETKQRAASA